MIIKRSVFLVLWIESAFLEIICRLIECMLDEKKSLRIVIVYDMTMMVGNVFALMYKILKMMFRYLPTDFGIEFPVYLILFHYFNVNFYNAIDLI